MTVPQGESDCGEAIDQREETIEQKGHVGQTHEDDDVEMAQPFARSELKRQQIVNDLDDVHTQREDTREDDGQLQDVARPFTHFFVVNDSIEHGKVEREPNTTEDTQNDSQVSVHGHRINYFTLLIPQDVITPVGMFHQYK